MVREGVLWEGCCERGFSNCERVRGFSNCERVRRFSNLPDEEFPGALIHEYACVFGRDRRVDGARLGGDACSYQGLGRVGFGLG